MTVRWIRERARARLLAMAFYFLRIYVRQTKLISTRVYIYTCAIRVDLDFVDFVDCFLLHNFAFEEISLYMYVASLSILPLTFNAVIIFFLYDAPSRIFPPSGVGCLGSLEAVAR